jgi:hypothetical protein
MKNARQQQKMNEEAILYYAARPVEFVEDIILAKPSKEQSDILRSIANNSMVSVRSGHGTGKSAVEAWAVIWFMATRSFPKIPCTAPTQHQLFDILWAEINKWIRNSPGLKKDFTWTKEKIYMKGYPEEWFAVARTATKPDALQGFHAENVLYIIDEASGVNDAIFEPVLGALSTEGAKLLMCGNPTQLSGFFYESHNRNRASYKTFHIDGRQSERVSKEFVQTIINMYGEDSDVFRVRVAGDFPKQEKDVFIPLSLVEKSVMTEFSEPVIPQNIRVAADIARFGSDKTVIGYKIDERIKFYKKQNGQDTMRTADDIVICGEILLNKYKNYQGIITVTVDDGGVGGGVVDRLNQIKRNDPERFKWLDVVPVMFGQRIKHAHYYDTTTYMSAVVKKLLQATDDDGVPKPVELILPGDDNLVAQLSGRKYEITENSKIRVESKEMMKKRGLHSPDEADCVLLLCLPVKPKKGGNNGKSKM